MCVVVDVALGVCNLHTTTERVYDHALNAIACAAVNVEPHVVVVKGHEMKVMNNECVLSDAIASSPTQTGRASVHRAARHEQTMRVAPPPVQFGTGHEHIQAGQLVKHLLVLRSGSDD